MTHSSLTRGARTHARCYYYNYYYTTIIDLNDDRKDPLITLRSRHRTQARTGTHTGTRTGARTRHGAVQ